MDSKPGPKPWVKERDRAKTRSVSLDDKRWNKLKRKAVEEGVTVSELVKRLIDLLPD